MTPPIEAQIAVNVEEIRRRIQAACLRVGRPAEGVRLMAVTKTQPFEVVEAGYRAGLRLFGENRILEAQEKFHGFHGDCELHMIGHLQRNKARIAAELVSCVQSIDKAETAKALDARLTVLGRRMAIFLELNTSGEETKSGFPGPEELLDVIPEIAALKSLDIRGLMTIAPFTEDKAAIRRSFRALASLFEELKAAHPELPLTELSMGMSGDFELAIEEGATMVRIGTALFGQRSAL